MNFAVVVIGGSAGALSALQRVAADLDPEIPAAIFVVVHITPETVSALPHILTRSGPLFATHAVEGTPIAPGRIFIAPPNYHVFLDHGLMHVVDWARENGQRPSIDVLFRSSAATCGDTVCGVLLSGTLNDGVAGLHSIRNQGGYSIVQDPADAPFPDMPQNAILAGAVDEVAPAREIASAISAAVDNAIAGPTVARCRMPDDGKDSRSPLFTCPHCGGTLCELDEREQLRFRCEPDMH